MAEGNFLPSGNLPITYRGIVAIFEIAKHQFSGGTHSWAAEFVEDFNFRPIKVTWNPDGDPNVAEVKLEDVRIEDLGNFLKPVDQVQVVLLVPETTVNEFGETVIDVKRRIIFRGFPASMKTSVSENTEDITITCMGYRYYISRIACHSQTVFDDKNDVDFISGFPLIFNEGGRMNRLTEGGSLGTGRHSDDASYLFTWPAIKGFSTGWEDGLDFDKGVSEWIGHDFWTAGQALEYLFNRFKDPDVTLTLEVAMKDKDLQALNEIRLPELDVEGMSLSDAMSAVFASIGFHYSILPNVDTGEWEIKWWQPGVGTKTVDLFYPQVGQDMGAAPQGLQTDSIDMNFDFRSIANSYVGIGDLAKSEVEWILRKLWTASETENDENYYRSGFGGVANPDWETFKNVFRRWGFDGAGLITGLFKDFGTDLGTNFMARPRHLEDEALSRDDDEGVRLPAQVFVKHLGTFKRIDADVDVLAGELADGIYIDGVNMKVDGGESTSLKDIMKDVTDVKIITGLPADLPVSALQEDDDSKEIHLTRQASLRVPEFKFEERANTEYGTARILRDDTKKLEGFLDEKLAATKDPIVSTSITVPVLNYLLTPGTRIRKIVGRNITVGAEIVSVDLLVDSTQSLQISLADTRLRRFA